MGNLTLKDRPKGLLIKSSLHVCVQGQESHSLTAVPSSFVLFCSLCWTLENLLLTDWLAGWLIDWLTDWLIVIISVPSYFLLRLCSVLRDLVSVSASVELFRGPLTHTETYTQSRTHSYTWWDDGGTSLWPTAQWLSTPQEGSVCGEGVWSGRHTCRYTTQPGSSRGSRGRHSYLAYYHACASGGIPSFKFSTGV